MAASASSRFAFVGEVVHGRADRRAQRVQLPGGDSSAPRSTSPSPRRRTERLDRQLLVERSERSLVRKTRTPGECHARRWLQFRQPRDHRLAALAIDGERKRRQHRSRQRQERQVAATLRPRAARAAIPRRPRRARNPCEAAGDASERPRESQRRALGHAGAKRGRRGCHQPCSPTTIRRACATESTGTT